MFSILRNTEINVKQGLPTGAQGIATQLSRERGADKKNEIKGEGTSSTCMKFVQY